MERFLPIIWYPLLAKGKRHFSDLKRRAPQREPKPRLDLFCEGRKTEPDYFEAVRKVFGIEATVVKVHHIGVPYTIAKIAIEETGRQQRAARRGRPEEDDRIWAVFDRDEHPKFDEAVALCEAHGISVARSNPCFELWLILHLQDHDKPEQRGTLKQMWERLEGQLDGPKKFETLAAKAEEAERRAAEQLRRREREGAPRGNPSTTVGALVRALRRAAGPASRASP